MRYLPICVDIRHRPCLVVGGGEVAARKASMLLRAGATVRLVAPHIDPVVRALGERRDLQCVERAYERSDLQGVRLVIAATDDRDLNAAIAAQAAASKLWVNVVDDPAHCGFVMPAIVDRDPLVVAVSSAGSSPVLARLVRGRIEGELPSGLGPLAGLLGEYRGRIKAHLPDVEARRRFWEGLLDGPLLDDTGPQALSRARTAIEAALAAERPTAEPAELFHIPLLSGDPDDLTFRMQRGMQRAQDVMHDTDVPEPVLERCRRDALRHAVPEGDAAVAALRAALSTGSRSCWLTHARPPAAQERVLSALAAGGVRVRRGGPQTC